MSVSKCTHALPRFEYNEKGEQIIYHVCFCHIKGHVRCPYKQKYCIVQKEIDDIMEKLNIVELDEWRKRNRK
jgi:hypothetical protein